MSLFNDVVKIDAFPDQVYIWFNKEEIEYLYRLVCLDEPLHTNFKLREKFFIARKKLNV